MHAGPPGSRPRGAKAVTAPGRLIKHPDLRIVLIVMRAGSRLHEHKTDNRISVQTLTAHVQLNLPSEVIDLQAGHLLKAG